MVVCNEEDREEAESSLTTNEKAKDTGKGIPGRDFTNELVVLRRDERQDIDNGENRSDDEETKDKGETLEEENEFGWKTIRRGVGKGKTKKRSGNDDSVNADKAADDGSPNAKKHEGRNSKEQGKGKGKDKGKAV